MQAMEGNIISEAEHEFSVVSGSIYPRNSSGLNSNDLNQFGKSPDQLNHLRQTMPVMEEIKEMDNDNRVDTESHE